MHRRFRNADPKHGPHPAAAVFRWAVIDRVRRLRGPRPPGLPAPLVEPDLALIHGRSKLPRLTWIGHAGFLVTLDGCSVLIDPVFSGRVGGVYRRYCPPGLSFDQLPSIEAILITHNHYDHLDAGSIGRLDSRTPVVVPQGLGRWMRRRGRRVHELGWWETIALGRVEITLVPARHWSRRGLLDTNASWWGGYVVRVGDDAVYHAGDTAWFEGFDEIRRRLGPFRAAMLPVGGYDPAWFMEHHHLNPEQAGRAWFELGAERLVPMHWGSFQLTDEPLAEPHRRLLEWWAAEAGNVEADRLADLAVGESVVIGRRE
jgi:L-ascorbate metabolism protein UlaG (beta-lactamase superfamily)